MYKYIDFFIIIFNSGLLPVKDELVKVNMSGAEYINRMQWQDDIISLIKSWPRPI